MKNLRLRWKNKIKMDLKKIGRKDVKCKGVPVLLTEHDAMKEY